MNTFHIAPSDSLAAEAVSQVIKLMAKQGNGVLIAVRGSSCHGHDDYLYAVCEAPVDCTELGGRTEYMWSYVSAAKWLGQYRKLNPV